MCLVLLAARQDAFFGLSAAAGALQAELAASGTSAAIAGVLAQLPGAGRLALPAAPRSVGGGPSGTSPLQHFLYKAPARRQFLMPAFTPPLTVPSLQQARTLCAAPPPSLTVHAVSLLPLLLCMPRAWACAWLGASWWCRNGEFHPTRQVKCLGTCTSPSHQGHCLTSN